MEPFPPPTSGFPHQFCPVHCGVATEHNSLAQKAHKAPSTLGNSGGQAGRSSQTLCSALMRTGALCPARRFAAQAEPQTSLEPVALLQRGLGIYDGLMGSGAPVYEWIICSEPPSESQRLPCEPGLPWCHSEGRQAKYVKVKSINKSVT